MPKFNFKSTVSEADVQKDVSSKKSTLFSPGTYDLKVVGAEFKGPMKGDSSWLSYQVTLGGIDDRKIRVFLAVPTSGPYYTKPGGKPTMFLFHKFREVVKAFGEDSSVDALNRTINKLFKDPSNLEGKVLKVDIGYPSYYAQFIPQEGFKLMNKQGTPVVDTVFPDRDSVIVYGASENIKVAQFAEVLKYHEKVVKEDTTGNGWGE